MPRITPLMIGYRCYYYVLQGSNRTPLKWVSLPLLCVTRPKPNAASISSCISQILQKRVRGTVYPDHDPRLSTFATTLSTNRRCCMTRFRRAPKQYNNCSSHRYPCSFMAERLSQYLAPSCPDGIPVVVGNCSQSCAAIRTLQSRIGVIISIVIGLNRLLRGAVQ